MKFAIALKEKFIHLFRTDSEIIFVKYNNKRNIFRKMDEKDKKIIKILQKNARTQFNEIATSVQLSNAAVCARVLKLERSGLIAGYHAEIDTKKIGKEIEVFIKITIDHSKDDPEETIKNILKISWVVEVFALTGEWDYHVHAFVANMSELKKLTTKIIKQAVPHMIRSDTSIVMLAEQKSIDV